MELSKRRSAAVVSVLRVKYHVAPARLDSFGAGPYAPVASNDTDAGRTQGGRRIDGWRSLSNSGLADCSETDGGVWNSSSSRNEINSLNVKSE